MPEETVVEKPEESTIERIDSPDISSNFLEAGADITKPLEKDAGAKPVDFSAFDKIKTDLDPNHKEEKKPDDTKPKIEEGKKEEPKELETKALAEPPTKGEDKPPVIPQQVEDDKTKYGEAAAALFPKMAAPAREFFKARLDDIKSLNEQKTNLELKLKQSTNGLPTSYYEHPDAYVLDPRFKQAQQTIGRFQQEQEIWEQQLYAIKNGDKWQMPSYDEKGNIVYSERDPSPEAERFVEKALNKCDIAIESQKQGIRGIVDTFKQSYEAQRKATTEMEDKYFPAYAGDKGKDNKYIKVFKDVLSSLGQENNPISSSFSKLYAWTMEQTEYIKELESKVKQIEKNGKVALQAGPNSGDLNNAPETKKQGVEHKPFDLDEFRKAKEQ